MRAGHLRDTAALVSCVIAVLLVPGCQICLLMFGAEGMTGLEGWVVEAAPGRPSDITLQSERIEPTEGLVKNAWVELWTGDGEIRLDRIEADTGSYGVRSVGPYEPGMRYLVKAGAPGYLPLNMKIKLKAGGNWALIQLAPAMNRQH